MTNVVTLQPATNQPAVTGNEVPDFITRVDISRMNDQQLDAMLETIRARRMTPILVYKQTQAEHALIQEAKVRERVEKKEQQIIKKLAVVDKHFEDLEKFVNELRGLRIQAGLEII